MTIEREILRIEDIIIRTSNEYNKKILEEMSTFYITFNGFRTLFLIDRIDTIHNHNLYTNTFKFTNPKKYLKFIVKELLDILKGQNDENIEVKAHYLTNNGYNPDFTFRLHQIRNKLVEM